MSDHVCTITVVAASDSAARDMSATLVALLAPHGKVLSADKQQTEFPGENMVIRFQPNPNKLGTEGHSMPMMREPDSLTRGNTHHLRSGKVGAWFSRMPLNPTFFVVHCTSFKEPCIEVYYGSAT